jgi:hypothetical protein
VIPKLSKATIRHHTIAQSFERGQSYYRAGSVNSLIQRGDRLLARVEGSEVNDYQVDVQVAQGDRALSKMGSDRGLNSSNSQVVTNYAIYVNFLVVVNSAPIIIFQSSPTLRMV